jgi:iron(III) transport system permease protein
LVVWTLFVGALYFSIVFGSFTQLWGVNYSLTLQHYRDFMRAGWPVFLYTARVAAISAVPAMLLGLLIAYLVVRHRFWGRRFVEFGSLLSFATPGTVMGVAYIFAFNTGPWLLTASAVIIILALVFRNMPVSIRAAVAGLSQIDASLEEASTMLRARSTTTLRRILFPLLINTVIVGLIFAFVSAMTAVSQVIFLVSPGNQLATVLLLGWVEQGQLGRAAAMGTVLIVSMLLAIMLVLGLVRGLGVRKVGVEA